MATPDSLRFIVFLRRTRTGYSADVPDLDGCVATGMTVEHTRQVIAEAIQLHLEAVQQADERLPKPRGKLTFTIDEADGETFCTWVEVLVPQPAKV